ncbi:hypothetical protein GJ689_06640 [Rhodoplanes serenus]|uniref:Energy transducer TonB n=1 Tax=Rhodoplanes serenus TaxID=200615 RepID=A0A9X4XIX6_9BRAD|nr:hypothetical protein [Rhodoplanes serenus]MTW15883.1 hypothetical protein [Rhodoplanes serenus]
MRVALAISVAVHAVLWGLAGWLAHVPAAGPGMAAMEIELVRPEEAPPEQAQAPQPPETQAPAELDKAAAEPAQPEKAAAEPAQPEKAAAETAPEQPARAEPVPPSSASAQAAAPPDLPRPDQPPPSTPPQLAAVDPATAAAAAPSSAEPPAGEGGGTWFDSPLMNVAVGYETTDRKAKLTDREIAAVKARLASCWRPSPALADAPARLAVVLRVALRPDGSLAGDPSLLAASASPKGAVLLQTAMQALRSCPPVGLLPATKYKEWRLLDLAFAPSGLTGLPKL